MRVRIKICGVTRLEDARAVWSAGADALGLNFWASSPRCVTPAQALSLARTRPAFGSVVGVFVNEDAQRIREWVQTCRLTAVQLHGDEPPDFCRGFGVPVIKALRIRNPEDVEKARSYVGQGDVSGLLLDGAAPAYGGGGVSFDWSWMAALRNEAVELFLAGGLTPKNVLVAAQTARPHAVDVASGVESSPGIKDSEAIHAFVRAVHAFSSEGDA